MSRKQKNACRQYLTCAIHATVVGTVQTQSLAQGQPPTYKRWAQFLVPCPVPKVIRRTAQKCMPAKWSNQTREVRSDEGNVQQNTDSTILHEGSVVHATSQRAHYSSKVTKPSKPRVTHEPCLKCFASVQAIEEKSCTMVHRLM